MTPEEAKHLETVTTEIGNTATVVHKVGKLYRTFRGEGKNPALGEAMQQQAAVLLSAAKKLTNLSTELTTLLNGEHHDLATTPGLESERTTG